jgi:hypothetical protein
VECNREREQDNRQCGENQEGVEVSFHSDGVSFHALTGFCSPAIARLLAFFAACRTKRSRPIVVNSKQVLPGLWSLDGFSFRAVRRPAYAGRDSASNPNPPNRSLLQRAYEGDQRFNLII